MCGIFGFVAYGDKPMSNLEELTTALACESQIRGTDATGIAHIKDGKIIIHKEAKPACNMKFKHGNTRILTGHTRAKTSGSEKKNHNNHPFYQTTRDGLSYALSHNGVLTNEHSLRKKYHLPKSKIETDSYVACQLISTKNNIDEGIKFMGENVEGTYTFSILGADNCLRLVKGSSPLHIVHIPRKSLYVYASTEEILFRALIETELWSDVKYGHFEEIENISPGTIISITSKGQLTYDTFNYTNTDWYNCSSWWYYGTVGETDTESYTDALKNIASYLGYNPDIVDTFLADGLTHEEIEEFLYT